LVNGSDSVITPALLVTETKRSIGSLVDSTSSMPSIGVSVTCT
jgi:hypothetical protein